MNGQSSGFDDQVVVIGKNRQKPKIVKSGAALNGAVGAKIDTERKATGGANKAHQAPDHQRIAKVDRENEVAPPPKILPAVGKAIQQARGEKGLSQKDCAQKINEKPSVLQDYESGKAIPNVQILIKLERVLGVKLRGTDIGKELGVQRK